MAQSGVSGGVRSPVRRPPYQAGWEGLGQHGVLGIEKVGWMKGWGSVMSQNWGICMSEMIERKPWSCCDFESFWENDNSEP